MIQKRIRTRFAPSPTGPLHMGGVRTALYNYLFAKKHGGDFLLRIEDTDQTRFVPGAEQYIIEALNWCGIKIDEGVSVGGKFAPYKQSERKELGIYQKYAENLLEKGFAYLAFDTSEELDLARKNAEANKQTFMYGASSRLQMKNSLSLSKNEVEEKLKNKEPYVVRLKVPAGETVTFNDLIRGEVSFPSDTVDDKVLLKSDGMPTYHLAHIVDDILMEITHAVRGEEWLPSAPAHILTYQYLGLIDKMPQYAHLPLLLKPDGNGKLSKRDGDRLGFPVFPLEWKDPSSDEISSGYREKGYYPDAFVNMLAFLGWNPGTEQEIFNMEELIAAFSFEHVQKAGAKFNPEKTLWFNEQYLRNKSSLEIAENIQEKIQSTFKFAPNAPQLQLSYLEKAIDLLKPRLQFEHQISEIGNYLFVAPQNYDEQVLAKRWKPELKAFFETLCNKWLSTNDFNAAEAENGFKETASELNIKPGEVMQLLRVFISGVGAGVDLFGMIALLGREESVARIKMAISKL